MWIGEKRIAVEIINVRNSEKVDGRSEVREGKLSYVSMRKEEGPMEGKNEGLYRESQAV